MDESILDSVKAGIMTSDYTPFDQELIMYINTFLGVLNQLGVGKPGFEIADDTATWADFFGDTPWIPACKTWLKLRVMQIFDTSASSVKEQVVSEKIEELTWRIATQAQYGEVV